MNSSRFYLKIVNIKYIIQQECIQVGCIPPAAVAIMGVFRSTSPLGVGLDQIPLNFPLGCGSGPDPPQLPPWVWAWTRSPSTSPLGVGLDQIPLNFLLGCGPGTPPPGTRHPQDQTECDLFMVRLPCVPKIDSFNSNNFSSHQ